jgi:hypothetical protein
MSENRFCVPPCATSPGDTSLLHRAYVIRRARKQCAAWRARLTERAEGRLDVVDSCCGLDIQVFVEIAPRPRGNGVAHAVVVVRTEARTRAPC